MPPVDGDVHSRVRVSIPLFNSELDIYVEIFFPVEVVLRRVSVRLFDEFHQIEPGGRRLVARVVLLVKDQLCLGICKQPHSREFPRQGRRVGKRGVLEGIEFLAREILRYIGQPGTLAFRIFKIKNPVVILQIDACPVGI